MRNWLATIRQWWWCHMEGLHSDSTVHIVEAGHGVVVVEVRCQHCKHVRTHVGIDPAD